jgi:uncharacterized protein (DUF1015 family)
MAHIAPFRGLRYNPELIADLSLVVAPPYDVISPEGQRILHARHDRNVIRLILGESLVGDDAERNRYSRAADYFRRWQAEKILVRDPVPALYLYQQIFRPDSGGELTRSAVIALVRLEEFGGRSVLPHERTIPGPKEDRLRLMQSCSANLSPVFGVYPDAPSGMDRLLAPGDAKPEIDLLDGDGVRHRVWICEERSRIESIRRGFEPTPILIADGHHRYETALIFRDMLRASDRGDPALVDRRPYNYIMMALVSADDPGLLILPIHRLLKRLPADSLSEYLRQIAPQFTVEHAAIPKDPEAGAAALLRRLHGTGTGPHRFGLYAGGEDGYVLTLADERILEQGPSATKPTIYRRLDVSIVHEQLIEGPLRRQGRPTPSEDAITYTHDPVEALRSVRQGGWAAAFLLNPTRIAEVQEVAMLGLRMPPKSTFFYPKLLTGLVINPINRDETAEV